jgi:hypothetical protein
MPKDIGQTAAGDSFCPGTSVAFTRRDRFAREPHDRRFLDHFGKPTGGLAKPWGDCWKCGKSLGCTICTTTNATEILCRRCGAWGTPEAFEHHGPIVPGGRIRYVADLAEYLAHWPRPNGTPSVREGARWVT